MVALAGDFLEESSEVFKKTVSERFESGIRNIVLDMTGVGSIDSVGLESLLWVNDESTRNSGRFKLVGVVDAVSEALTVTRLVRRFDLEESVESAARSLR